MIPIIKSNVFGKSLAQEFMESPCKERMNPVETVHSIILSDLLIPGGTDDVFNHNGTNNPAVTYDQFNVTNPEEIMPSDAGSSSCTHNPLGACESMQIIGATNLRWLFRVRGFCEIKNRLYSGNEGNASFFITIGFQGTTPSTAILINEDLNAGAGEKPGVTTIDKLVTISLPRQDNGYSFGLAASAGKDLGRTKRIAGTHPTTDFPKRCWRNSARLNNVPETYPPSFGDPYFVQVLQVGPIAVAQTNTLTPYDYITVNGIGVIVRDSFPPFPL